MCPCNDNLIARTRWESYHQCFTINSTIQVLYFWDSSCTDPVKSEVLSFSDPLTIRHWQSHGAGEHRGSIAVHQYLPLNSSGFILSNKYLRNSSPFSKILLNDCNWCDFSTPWADNLRSHMKAEHWLLSTGWRSCPSTINKQPSRRSLTYNTYNKQPRICYCCNSLRLLCAKLNTPSHSSRLYF